MSTPDAIRAVIGPDLAPLGLVVEDVSVSQAGRRRMVRVLVDTDISGLAPHDTSTAVGSPSLDTVADATRAVGDALDVTDVMGDAPYVLEVSSPGVGRGLTTREQLRRQVGRLIEVAHSGSTTTGRLLDVGPDHLTLEIPPEKKTPSRSLCLALDTVERGTVQVEFTRHEADGSPPEHEEDT